MRINSVQIILIARIRHKRLCFRNAKYFSIEERETETRSEISNAGALERESWNAKNCYIGTRNAKAKSRKSGTQDAKAFRENHAHLWLGYHVPTVWDTRPSLTRIPRIFLWDTRPSLTRIPRTYEIHDHPGYQQVGFVSLNTYKYKLLKVSNSQNNFFYLSKSKGENC